MVWLWSVWLKEVGKRERNGESIRKNARNEKEWTYAHTHTHTKRNKLCAMVYNKQLIWSIYIPFFSRIISKRRKNRVPIPIYHWERKKNVRQLSIKFCNINLFNVRCTMEILLIYARMLPCMILFLFFFFNIAYLPMQISCGICI